MYTGEMMDANALVYLRARYYHPRLGVFTGLDPVEGGNRYQYVGGNVTNFTDPSGLQEDFLEKCRGLPQPLKGWCFSEVLELGASIFEGSVDDASDGPLGPLDEGNALRQALEEHWIYAAHFMYLYLGFYEDDHPKFKNPFRMGEPRYFNICAMLAESPNVWRDLQTNFISCVINSDTSWPPCTIQGSQVSGGVKNPNTYIPYWADRPSNATQLSYEYENPDWLFRLGFNDVVNPDLARALKTFSVGAHDTRIVETYDTAQNKTTFQAYLEFWDNYDWVNNEDNQKEGSHPFGMLASDFKSVEQVGLAKPYTMFSGLIYTVTEHRPAGECVNIPCITYTTNIRCVHPSGESLYSYISSSLESSGFSPRHNRFNTPNVRYFP